jgi:hypothetical protein
MTVAKWRTALGVTRTNNAGTHALVLAATAKAIEAFKDHDFTDEERRQRSERMKALQLWHRGENAPGGKEWTDEEAALLGTMPDSAVARRTGHTLGGVRGKRKALCVPRFPAAPPVGAIFEPRTGRRCASISVRGRRVRLGTFDTKEEAHQVYLGAVKERDG